MLDRPAYLVMPPPISTNNLFRNVEKVGRVATADYKAWQRDAQSRLQAQRPLPQFVKPVSITVFVGEKGVSDMDSDNTAKAYLDALVKGRVIPDDNRKWVRSFRVMWAPGIRGAVVEVIPARDPPPAAEILARIKPNLHSLLT